MVDITNKKNTLRIATAQAVVKVGSKASIEAIKSGEVPKGDVLQMAKAAALFASKHTHNTIPLCHPIPVQGFEVEFDLSESSISIHCTVKTIYTTGVEVEAMHAASVAALTIYDMLKPIEPDIEIANIKLLQKTGGKADFENALLPPLKCGLIVCYDDIFYGKKQNNLTLTISDFLKKKNIVLSATEMVPEDIKTLQDNILGFVNEGVDLVLVSGSSGIQPTDIAAKAIEKMLDRPTPGISEAMRYYGLQRTPHALLSANTSGIVKNTLLVSIPGSTSGAIQSLEAIIPDIFHLVKSLRNAKKSP